MAMKGKHGKDGGFRFSIELEGSFRKTSRLKLLALLFVLVYMLGSNLALVV